MSERNVMNLKLQFYWYLCDPAALIEFSTHPDSTKRDDKRSCLKDSVKERKDYTKNSTEQIEKAE